MNLRTITVWTIYDPKLKVIIEARPTKKALLGKDPYFPHGCVVVKLKGHYLRPSASGKANG